MRSTISGFSPFMSVPPHTSTSSSNTMPPRFNTMSVHACSFMFLWFSKNAFLTNFIFPYIIYSRASNSDLIHPTFFSSLSGCLLTFTQVLTSVWRSFISRFILFISVSSRSNTVGVHDTTPRLSELDFIASLHTIYGYLTGLLLTLTGIKYQGSSTNPFSEHPTLMTLFLISILVYVIALIILTRSNQISDHCPDLMVGVCHISGALACELLLLVLISPMRSLIINVSSIALIAMLVLCYKHVLYLLHAEGTEISETESGEEQGSEMVDLEAPAISTP